MFERSYRILHRECEHLKITFKTIQCFKSIRYLGNTKGLILMLNIIFVYNLRHHHQLGWYGATEQLRQWGCEE
ncbi:hypothetical protein BpHYR1_045316 [Brachionus plicatilis]|uniref:Uncharacterized protein n=1 Tax=Brachionus plicatilis TaxID=10195 RepID=A0A3M7PIY2_BRAPC|nr:hypothetical protein BpHYR1_045316 [Brachionus plicatilis]